MDVNHHSNEAEKNSKSKQYCSTLATKSVIKSKGLSQYIKKNKFPKSFKIFKINGSNLVELVESGKFLRNTKIIVKKLLKNLQIF